MADCQHPKAQTKRYVGTQETYHYCPTCLSTWGGEEGPRKRSLIAAAARAEDVGATVDHEHLGF